MSIRISIVMMTAALSSACGSNDAGAPDATAAPDAAAAPSDSCPAAWTTAPTVDPSLALPADGGAVVLHTHAVGTQSYACVQTTGTDGNPVYTWTFTHPTAQLFDCHQTPVGAHSAPTAPTAPQWSNVDGSVVEGHKVAAFTPDPSSIPWLLLAASSHTGTGIMSGVKYIQRVDTVGGNAPATGCDAGTVGATTDIGYAADYYFFGAR